MMKKLMCLLGIHNKKRYVLTHAKTTYYGIKVVYDLYECPHCKKNIEKSRTSFYEYPPKTSTQISISAFLSQQYSNSTGTNHNKRYYDGN